MRRTCCLLLRYEEALRCYDVGSHGTHSTRYLLARRGRPDLLTTFEDLMRHTDRQLREVDKVAILRTFAAENKGGTRSSAGGGAEDAGDVSTRYHQLFTRLVQSHPRTHGPPFALLQAALEGALELCFARSAEVLLERYLHERAVHLNVPQRSGDRLRPSADPRRRSASSEPTPSRLPTSAAAAALRDDALARLVPGKAGPPLARAFRLTDLASSVGVLPTLRTALVLVSHAAAAAAATKGAASGSYADVVGTLARIEGAAGLDPAARPRHADVAAATGASNNRPGWRGPPAQEAYFKELTPGLRASADYQTAVLSALADVVEGASARLGGLLLSRLRDGGGERAVASPAEAALLADGELAQRQLRSRLALLRAGGGGGGGGGGGAEGPLALEQFKHALRGAEARRDAGAAAEAADAAVRFLAAAGAAAGDVADAKAQYDARKLRVAAEAALDCAFRGAEAAVQGQETQQAENTTAAGGGAGEEPVEEGGPTGVDVAAVEQLWAELTVRFPPQPQPAQPCPAPPSASPPSPAAEAALLPSAPPAEEGETEVDAEAAAAAAAAAARSRQLQERRQRRHDLRRQHEGDFRACMAHCAWRVWAAHEAVLKALPPPSTAPQTQAAATATASTGGEEIEGSATAAAAAAAELGASLRCASQAYEWWVTEAAEEEEEEGASGGDACGIVERLKVLGLAGDVPGFERVVSGRRDLPSSVVALRQLCYASARRRAERQLGPPSETGDGCGELLPMMHVGAIHPLSPYADAAAYHRWAMMCTPLVTPVLAPPPTPTDAGEVVAPGRRMAPPVARARAPTPARMAERPPQLQPRLRLQPQRSGDVDVSPPVLPSSSSAKTGRAPTGMYMNAVRVRNDGRPVSKIKSI